MKAPDKIYISPLPNHSDGYVGVAWDEPHKTMVEYTRTDALIEKACEYLQEHLIDYWSQGVTDESNFVEDFKKHMKGE